MDLRVSPRSGSEGSSTRHDDHGDDQASASGSASKPKVFSCTHEGCSSAFGTRAHLSRHMKSHEGTAAMRYPCVEPGCGLRFTRSLKLKCVLESEDDPSCVRCQAKGETCHFKPKDIKRSISVKPEPVSPELFDPPPPPKRQRFDTSPSITPSDTSLHLSGPTPPDLTIPQNPPTLPTEFPRHDPFLFMGQSDVPAPPPVVPPNPPTFPTANIAPATGLLPTFDLGFSAFPPDDFVAGDAAATFDNSLGWGWDQFNDHQLDFSAFGFPLESWTPTGARTPAAGPRPGGVVNFASQLDTALLEEKEKVSSDPLADAEGHPSETLPWPQVYAPTRPVGRLVIPRISAPARVSLEDQSLSSDAISISEDTRRDLIELVHTSHQSAWTMDINTFPSATTLALCIDLYFKRFHDTFPILRKDMIKAGHETAPILLLAMAGIGATYLKEGFDGLAVTLSEVVRRALTHMELEKQKEAPTDEERQAAYLEDEERLRLGWGIYIFDAQIASLLNTQSLFSISEVTAWLPDSDEVWNSANASAWASLLATSNRPLFRPTLDGLLTNGKLYQPLNAFGSAIMAHTLVRLCVDAAMLNAFVPPTQTTSPYRIAFPPRIKHNPQQLLDTLAAAWFTRSSAPTFLLVSSTSLNHHSVIQLSCPDFLRHLKMAAGAADQEMKATARSWLVEKMVSDPVVTRRILVHAALLNALLMRFTFEYEPLT
ncbi:Fungal transcriptional regulatory protein [Pseudohyphozyma bogoriensis]|nr:Fungal transcriptional regulatory protein [Pseudohyphozyma bogoriensis]